MVPIAIVAAFVIVSGDTSGNSTASAAANSFEQRCVDDWNENARPEKFGQIINGSARGLPGNDPISEPSGDPIVPVLVDSYQGRPATDFAVGGGGSVKPGDCLVVTLGGVVYASTKYGWVSASPIGPFADYSGLTADYANAHFERVVSGSPDPSDPSLGRITLDG